MRETLTGKIDIEGAFVCGATYCFWGTDPFSRLWAARFYYVHHDVVLCCVKHEEKRKPRQKQQHQHKMCVLEACCICERDERRMSFGSARLARLLTTAFYGLLWSNLKNVFPFHDVFLILIPRLLHHSALWHRISSPRLWTFFTQSFMSVSPNNLLVGWKLIFAGWEKNADCIGEHSSSFILCRRHKQKQGTKTFICLEIKEEFFLLVFPTINFAF